MNEIMTLAEIESTFDSEWVLLEDTEVGDHMRILRGKVVCHGKDRDEVYQKLIDLRPRQAATLYTGKMPEDTAIIL